jgi:tetratricopeptide (TPR) repeat protein
MKDLDSIMSEIEKDLEVERCEAALPELLRLTESDNPGRTRVYLTASRCYLVAGDAVRKEAMLQQAKETAEVGPIESKVRVACVEASSAIFSHRPDVAGQKLEFAAAHLDELSSEIRGLTQSIRGRCAVLQGAYSDAIEFSQEAIDLSAPHSSTASFAYGTLASVFQTMGRIDESEQFGLEQIRILMERGSRDLAGLYAFLAEGASSRQDWQKAMEYQGLAMSTLGNTPAGSALRPTILYYLASAELGTGHYQKAIEYVEQGIAIASREGPSQFSLSAQMLHAEIRLRNGEAEMALALMAEPLELSSRMTDEELIMLNKTLAEIYQALGRKAEAFDICWRLWELQTDFDVRTREALLRYHRALEQKIHAQKTAILNLKATQMERELALTATQLSAQVDLLGRFRNEMREIVRENEEPSSTLKKVKEKLKDLPCQAVDWAPFEAQFATVHPDFKSILEEKHPDLTRSEIKICSLSRLKLTSEEIGRLQCLSARSVETHRLNIRRKLGLKKEQNLVTYLAGLRSDG